MIYEIEIWRNTNNGGVYYHYYSIDRLKKLEIHQGEFTNYNIRPIKKDKKSTFCGYHYLCKECYNDVYTIVPFYIFPFINCETLTKSTSFQGISLFVGIICGVLATKSLLSLIILLFIFILYYWVNNFMVAPTIWYCDHIKK